MTTARPDAGVTYEAIAPYGVAALARVLSALDVRCRCNKLLIRVVRVGRHELVVVRHHSPPTHHQLEQKQEGTWSGARHVAPDYEPGPAGIPVRSWMSTPVGWTDHHAVWLDDADPGRYSARCECGRTLVTSLEQVRRWRRTGRRALPAPDDLLLDEDQYRAHLAGLSRLWSIDDGDTLHSPDG